MPSYHFSSTHFFQRSFISLLLTALLLVVFQQDGRVDFTLANFYFDPVSNTFPLKHQWVTEKFLHVYLKWLLVCFGLFWIFLALISAVFPNLLSLSTLTIYRIRFVAISAAVIPITISTLKSFSPVHCPWDLMIFGGRYPHISFLQSFASDLSPGHCSPAGHAASGLWLSSLSIFYLPTSPNLATSVLFTGLGGGFLLGWGQQMRGAHFLSHTLWSVWITLFLLVVMWKFSHRTFNKLVSDKGMS